MNDTDRARSALQAIDPGCQRTEWATIGMAFKDAGGSLDDFIAWSEGASNFGSERDCRDAWRSFKPGPTTRATLFAKAREAGWREPMNGHAKPHQKAPASRKPWADGKAPSFDFAAVWRDSEPATAAHPYIARKLGLPDGLRVYRGPLPVAGQALDGALLVPVLDADGKLQSWQAIPPEGKKVNAPGVKLAGGRFTVGGAPRDGEPLYLCEGIGQAWSAYQATGKPAIVCFGAGNVERIALQLRERHPGARIVIVADAGKERDAERIAKAVGGAWVGMPEGSPPNFDLNDLHQREGMQAALELLERVEQTAPAEPVFSFVALADLDTNPPPEREWVAHEWLPRSTLVAMFGGGGIGKSLLSQQIATCVGNGVPVFGQPVARGPVLALFGEDDPEELRRRQRAILAHMGRSPVYSAEGMHFDGRAGRDSTLMTFGADRMPLFLPLFEHLRHECARLRPVLVILDNIAQMFGGIENDRHQVTVFANALTGIAREFECCVLLLGHVAKAVGSEYSGSTAWEAAVRTRLWLERREDGLIELHKAKANYSARGSVVMEYRHGAFAEIQQDGSGIAESLLVKGAEEVVLEALAAFTARQVATSHHPTARNNLISLASKSGELRNVPAPIAIRSLASLIDSGRVIPNAELGWRGSDRHRARGLALAPDTDAEVQS